MGRLVMLGNGELLVGLNEHGLVHDFYYPYVGLDNLTTARSVHHMIGVWVDGHFSWLDDGSWHISVDFETDAMVSTITAEKPEIGLKLHFCDFVDHQYDAFCRRVEIENTADQKREVRLFMHQVFQISNEGRADTVLFVPDGSYLFDYKGRCSLLIYAADEQGQPFDQFSVGNYGIEGKAGTFKDAEDGELSGNLVEHGGVDSVLRCRLEIEAGQRARVDYWIVASFSQHDAQAVHEKLRSQGLHSRLDRTREFWRDWLAVSNDKLAPIEPKYQGFFKKSLMLIKVHIDKRGGMIASGDSSIYNYGRDYYSYVWPRDTALTMLTLIELGYTEEPKRFFEFCADTIHPDGYMMHKYQPDRAIGSTWHPLMHQHHPELAIQEDETASVVYALGAYFQKTGDEVLIKRFYEDLLSPAANFMAGFIDEATNLPHASYDLWEERFATHTYTVANTIGALRSAANVATKLQHQEEATRWREAADKISDGMKLLFDPERQCYRKSLMLNRGGDLEFNNTIDSSSFYGVFLFDESRAGSDALRQSVETTEKVLSDISPSGGTCRYEHDNYFLTKPEFIGNPWFICGFWLAQYKANNGDKPAALKIIDNSLKHINASGVMSEQIDPVTGFSLGVCPLVWSHAELINTLVLIYP